MNYNEIIKPFLIDFDKLEVGQKLWSVFDGEIKILSIKEENQLPIKCFGNDYHKDGKLYENDKYPTLFTSNPFENLQRVEPLYSTVRENRTVQTETTEERDIR